eukprot:2047155-Pleurochrysis_carterae.AAC.1
MLLACVAIGPSFSCEWPFSLALARSAPARMLQIHASSCRCTRTCAVTHSAHVPHAAHVVHSAHASSRGYACYGHETIGDAFAFAALDRAALRENQLLGAKSERRWSARKVRAEFAARATLRASPALPVSRLLRHWSRTAMRRPKRHQSSSVARALLTYRSVRYEKSSLLRCVLMRSRLCVSAHGRVCAFRCARLGVNVRGRARHRACVLSAERESDRHERDAERQQRDAAETAAKAQRLKVRQWQRARPETALSEAPTCRCCADSAIESRLVDAAVNAELERAVAAQVRPVAMSACMNVEDYDRLRLHLPPS